MPIDQRTEWLPPKSWHADLEANPAARFDWLPRSATLPSIFEHSSPFPSQPRSVRSVHCLFLVTRTKDLLMMRLFSQALALVGRWLSVALPNEDARGFTIPSTNTMALKRRPMFGFLRFVPASDRRQVQASMDAKFSVLAPQSHLTGNNTTEG